MSSNSATIDRRGLLRIIGASAVATGGLTGVSAAEGSTIVVEEGESIQDAINNANDGDTIKVEPGTYEVRGLEVRKTLTLVGEPGGDDIGPSDDAPVIKPKNDDYREGISFRDDGNSTGTGSEIRGFVFRDFEWRGISGGEAIDDVTVEDNRFEDLGRGVATFSGDRRKYVGWTIRRNEVKNAFQGFGLTNVNRFTIEKNRITAVDDAGISINPQDGNSDIGVSEVGIVDNQIKDCGFGVYLLARNDKDAGKTIEMSDVTVKKNVVSEARELAYPLSVGSTFDQGAVATIRDVVYKENTAWASNAGFRIDTQVEEGVRNVAFKNNDVSDVEVFGFKVACGDVDSDTVPVSGVTYEGNTVSSSRSGFEVSVNAGKFGDVAHRGNRVTNSAFGVRAVGHAPEAVEELQLTENDFVENEIGVGVRTVADGITLRQNRIVDNNKWGAINQSEEVLDAVRNYWGAPTGPERPHPVSNQGGGNGRPETLGDGDRVSEKIEVKPWLSQPP